MTYLINIAPKEKQLGLFVKVFKAETLADALELKSNWLSKNKHLIVVKQKHRRKSGKGRVVGKWTQHTVAIFVVRKDRYNDLMKHRRG